MRKTGLFIFGVVLLLSMISSVSAQEAKSFEDVLRDYGMKEDLVFNDGSYTSYEVEGIPSYKFTYIMDIEFSQHPLGYFLNIFGLWYQTKTVRVPAIDMTDEEWIQNAHLFIIPKEEFIEELLMEYGIRKRELVEIVVVNQEGGLPSYSIQSNIKGRTPDGSDMKVSVPAIEMGSWHGTECINGKLTVVERKTAGQLWELWGFGGGLELDVEQDLSC